MELLNRYRNISVLLLVIFAQLVLLAYQVKGQGDVRLIRVWAVTAITPVAKVVDSIRGGVTGVVRNYLLFKDLRSENEQLRRELGKTKLETQRLRTELETADRLKALATFQAQSPSKTLPARVIATGTGANSRVVFLDRGSRAGVMRGMAVITADGIVGKVIGSYPTAAQVLLITDPTFAAGVISQKHRVRGMVRGLGQGNCRVDYIQNEETVDPGEKFFTSGDDGVFPRGLPVGTVTVVRLGTQHKEVFLAPSGLQAGLEEVLVILEGVHQTLPDLSTPSREVRVQPAPDQPAPAQPAPAAPGATAPPQTQPPAHLTTEADRLREKYRQLGEAQGHTFGEGLPGSRPPDFNLTPEEAAARAARARAAAAAKAAAAKPQGDQPPTSGTTAAPKPAVPAAKPPTTP
jgi:rod shape-determining protein MreC